MSEASIQEGTEYITQSSRMAVWEFAGNILKKNDLQQNGELQYSLFKWLRLHNTLEKNGTDCRDGFFEPNAAVRVPIDKINIIKACTISLALNSEQTENIDYTNDIAIIGNDTSSSVNVQSFYQAAMRAGYDKSHSYDRIASVRNITTGLGGNFGAVKSGRELLNVLKKYGSKENPITGIFFSTHGVPYAIDFHKPKCNLYVPLEEMCKIADDPEWQAGKTAAFVSDIQDLVFQGIIAENATITLCGCLNGASPANVLSDAEPYSQAWKKINEKNNPPKNIAFFLSKALPLATVIANKTQVNSGEGMNSPVMYKNGKITQ